MPKDTKQLLRYLFIRCLRVDKVEAVKAKKYCIIYFNGEDPSRQSLKEKSSLRDVVQIWISPEAIQKLRERMYRDVSLRTMDQRKAQEEIKKIHEELKELKKARKS